MRPPQWRHTSWSASPGSPQCGQLASALWALAVRWGSGAVICSIGPKLPFRPAAAGGSLAATPACCRRRVLAPRFGLEIDEPRRGRPLAGRDRLRGAGLEVSLACAVSGGFDLRTGVLRRSRECGLGGSAAACAEAVPGGDERAAVDACACHTGGEHLEGGVGLERF